MDHYRAILAALWDIKRTLDTDPPEYGICYGVHTRLCFDYDGALWAWEEAAQRAFEAWAEFSGSSVYPVPGPAGRADASHAFLNAEDTPGAYWTGEYGSARIRLLNHCIKSFQRAIDTGVPL